MRNAMRAVVIGSLLATGCCRDDYEARDEKTVRCELDLPASAELVHIEGLPNDPHLSQREGLRIDATFQLDEDARKEYGPHARRFLPVPVPSNVASFTDPPPPDMTGATSGKYFCQVQVYAPNSNAITSVHPCSTPPKERADRNSKAM